MPVNQATDGPRAAVFDALPFPALIVDEDILVHAANPAAFRMFRADPGAVLRRRGGEVLHCVNSANGCGRSPACSDCVIRGAVTFAATEGQAVRRKARLERVVDGNVHDMHALVTATPIHVAGGGTRVLVFIEDLALLLARTDALPICMGCKKVRDENLWMQVEAYLDSHLDLKFTHGICPDCMTRLYPDHAGRR